MVAKPSPAPKTSSELDKSTPVFNKNPSAPPAGK
jgi:hypothetical protein